MNKFRDKLIALPRSRKRALMMTLDCVGLLVAFCGALLLQGLALSMLVQPWWQLPLGLALGIACAARVGLYTAVIRYMALRVALNIFKAVALLVGVLLIAGLFAATPQLQPAVAINFGILLMLVLGGGRLLARTFLATGSDRDAERLIIFGAGEAGAQVARSLASDRRRRVVGFIDEKPDIVGSVVAGLPVYSASNLPDLIDSMRIASVLLALPSVSRQRKDKVLNWLEPFPVTVKTVPALHEILSGEARISDIRDIEIEDLLGRDPVPPDEALLSRSITGRTVMVTGAGGSIGSELCRQIVQLRPDHLVLFEVNEPALFHVECELYKLMGSQRGIKLTAILGNVLDVELVSTSIRRLGVQTLYHAAAYKHVPLVEQNVAASLRNNVFGTLNVAEAAAANGVERFILISTDKAVRPTNVMGATKRIAELVVQALAARSKLINGSACIFSMVRFGNVLGSSGSVVPKFREQIRAGGPVTVTHPEITRFFMTIPEASQLVIQAGAMAKGGEVFVLDMGEPIPILNLAKRMIHLAGYSVRDEADPAGDIEVVFTGLRPGEKLYEELLIGEASLATNHSKVGCSEETCLPWSQLKPLLDQMNTAADSYRRGWIKSLLRQAVPEYQPAEQDHDIISIAEERERLQAQIVGRPNIASVQ